MIEYMVRQVILVIIVASLFANVTAQTLLHLFEAFPQLKAQIPHITLCDLPTPVMQLESFGNYIGHENIYIKRDDLSGTYKGNGFRLNGGNKPRKLEFLLADAIAHDAETIITYGCAGSNHALATAVYAKTLGLNSILMLKPQPNSYTVRHNLLLDLAQDADIRWFANNTTRADAAQELLFEDPHAYLIPTGGSNAIGGLGFVNAAFELYEQVKQNEVPMPDYIYLATSSCATTAGLLLGFKLLDMPTKVMAICIEPEDYPGQLLHTLEQLFKAVNQKLHEADASIPVVDFPHDHLIINKKFCGTTYGLFIPEGQNAAQVFKDTENIRLDGTYSAKPVAAIIDDVQAGLLQDKVVLFWNTYCGIDYSYMTHMAQFHALPHEFHCYFEEPVQPFAN
ncbi:MAG: 1-aminocyclopropane-1-carboxylate deaminase/D-cysteine desulfhydrase [Candidatus Babeliales bacterium]